LMYLAMLLNTSTPLIIRSCADGYPCHHHNKQTLEHCIFEIVCFQFLGGEICQCGYVSS
jgi:hypothetical protein